MEKRFIESMSTAVLTTKFVLEDKSPILYIYHYKEDGMWQFSGPEIINDEKDFRVVALEEILNLDISILELADLPIGAEAYRSDNQSPWIVK